MHFVCTINSSAKSQQVQNFALHSHFKKLKFVHLIYTLWCQLEDMFHLIVTPQGIEKVMIQLKDTPTKVYAIGAELFLSKVPLEVLQN